MLAATSGVSTHRGAIFGLGLLCAAAGARGWRPDRSSDDARRHRLAPVAGAHRRWTPAARQSWRQGPSPLRGWRRSHGGTEGDSPASTPSACQRCGGVRSPRPAMMRRRVQACFALVATVEDTNLLHRGGLAGLRFARRAARRFLDEGGVGRRDGASAHEESTRASSRAAQVRGGSADLLAMTLFVEASDRCASSASSDGEAGPLVSGVILLGARARVLRDGAGLCGRPARHGRQPSRRWPQHAGDGVRPAASLFVATASAAARRNARAGPAVRDPGVVMLLVLRVVRRRARVVASGTGGGGACRR